MAEHTDECTSFVKDKLQPVLEILPLIAAGDFTKKLDIPEEDDEFALLFMGINYLQTELALRFPKGAQDGTGDGYELSEGSAEGIMQMEKALMVSEERYKTLVETSDDMIFTVNLRGDFMFTNKAMEKYLGYSREELRDINGFDLIHPDDMQHVAEQFTRLPTGENVSDLEYRYRTKNGTYIHILNNAGPIYDEDGIVIAAFGIARNITHRKEMESELIKVRDELERRVEERTDKLEKANSQLRLSEDKYRLLLDNANEGIGVAQDGKIKYFNPKVRDIIGYTNEEIVSKPFIEFIHPEDKALVRVQHMKRLEGDSPLPPYTVRVLTKQGEVKLLEINGVKITWEGRPATLNFLSDVSERKMAEEALKESEAKFRGVVEQSTDGFVLLDETGSVIEWNHSQETITGLKREEVMGKSFWDVIFSLMPDEDKSPRKYEYVNSQIQDYLRTGMAHWLNKPLERRIRLPDGSFRTIQSLVFPIVFPKGKMVGSITRDITHQKEAEEALRISEDRYRKISELISDFVYSIRIEPDGTQVSEWSTDTITRIMGICHDELLKGGWKDIIHPDDLPSLGERQMKLGSGEPDIREYRVLRKGGDVCWVRDYGNPVWDEAQGRVVRIYGAAQNITDRKIAEEKLKQSEEKYTALFQRSNDAVYTCDFEGNFVDANPAALNMLGYTKDEITSLDFSSLLCPEQMNLALDKLREVIETGMQKDITEYRLKRKDGSFIWVESKGSLVYKEGQPVAVQGIARDITERKRAEEALQESEEKFRLLFENASEGILYIDLDGDIIGLNPKVLEIAGLNEGEVLGKNILDLTELFNLDPGSMIPIFQNMLSGNVPVNTEWEITNKRGENVVVLAHPSLVKKKGEIMGLSVIIEDITHRKKAEEALRESEEKFRNLAEKSPNMIFINYEGQIMYANEKCESVMGYTRDELYSEDFDFLSLIAAGSRDLVKSNFCRHIKGEEVPPYEYTLLTKKGERIDGILTTKMIRYGGHKAILGIVTDITERKRAEEALRKSEELYSAVVENSEDGIVIIQEGQLEFANNSSAQLLGYAPEGISGNDFLDFVAPHYREMVKINYANRIQGKNVPSIYEILLLRRDGSTVPVEINVTLIDYKGKPADLVFIRDVTERKRTEESLIHSEKLAGIGILSSGIAHEINNPLAGIMGYAEVILDEEDPDQIRHYAREIVRNTERASDIVNWLSRYSRGAKDTNITDVDLNEILSGSLQALKSTRDISGVNIIWDFSNIPQIKGNPSELQQIFLNLLNNAIDALATGGSVTLSTTADDGFVSVKVADNGKGISDDNIDRVFDPFFTTKNIGEGTGLGLYVTSMIVKKHYGEIAVNSTQGKGTAFTLRFPCGKDLPQISDFDYQSRKRGDT